MIDQKYFCINISQTEWEIGTIEIRCTCNDETVDLATPKPSITDSHVFLESVLPAAGMLVRLYSKGFGGNEAKLAEAKNDGQGYYKITYPLVFPNRVEPEYVHVCHQ